MGIPKGIPFLWKVTHSIDILFVTVLFMYSFLHSYIPKGIYSFSQSYIHNASIPKGIDAKERNTSIPLGMDVQRKKRHGALGYLEL